jgi:hypothetical protein
LQQAVENRNGFIRTPEVLPIDVMELGREYEICIPCGINLLQKDADLVCPGCGLVYGSSEADETIPFEESCVDAGHSEQQWSPQGMLAYGKDLGVHQNLDQMSLASILGGKKDGTDMPFAFKRAGHVRVRLDHPQVMRLLKLGSELCKKHGLKEKRNGNYARFADQVGINLRFAGSWCVAYGKPWADPWRFAASIFVCEFRKHYPDRYMQIRNKVAEEDLEIQKLETQISEGVDISKLQARKEKLLKDGMRAKCPEFCLSEAMLEYYGMLVKVSGALELPSLEDEANLDGNKS